jgi:phage terminase large subunit-like protein
MTPKERREQTVKLAKSSPQIRRRIIATMSWQDVLETDADYERWVHDSQLEPDQDGWRVWLLLAGRGFGKTRAGAEWIHRIANSRPGVRIALVGATIADARSIMVEGVSGLLAVAKAHRQKLFWEPSLGRLRWPNGSEAQLFSGDNADGLRGPEHDVAWCDELAKWRQSDEAWDNLQFGLRRGPRPRALVTTTPRSIPLLQRIKQLPWTAVTNGRTSDNLNLDEKFIEVMTATYGGTRLGRQELDGELIEDVEGSLWPRESIDQARTERPAAFERIVVGVDPPAGVGKDCDACGIVVAGRSQGRLYVIADESCQGLSPEGWARRVAAAVFRWDADMVVAESNNGGAMVGSVLKAAEVGVRVRLVHASAGKAVRAEPIALRFESGRAFFAGSFPQLEDELAALTAGGGYEGPTRSPDRADAMVWAMTELSETKSGVPRVRVL